MSVLRLAFVTLFCLCIPTRSYLVAQERSGSAQAASLPTAGLLAVSGRVVMPDGSPVAGATVLSMGDAPDRPISVRTNDAGEFRLRGVFGNGCRLHASSPVGSHQATLRVSASAARKVLAAPVELKLRPAVSHEVSVLAEKIPVEGAQVIAGNGFRCEEVTGRDGRAVLRLPAGEPLIEVAAWHPKLGADGRLNYPGGLPQESTTLSLHAPSPHTIRVIDPEEHGISDLELAVSVRLEDSEWILTRDFQGARVRTSADGTAIVPWMPPRETLKYVDVEFIGSDWKIDEINNDRNKEGITTVSARRKRAVLGRLVMPDGADAEGILVTGFGFGPKNNGDIPYARARRDGWFTLHIPAEHGYVLGIADLEWASNIWSGMILASERPGPARVSIETYAATPVTVRVTRGPNHDPVVDSWVESSSEGDVEWIDSSGSKRNGHSGVHNWLKTGADGEARTGVGRGKQKFRLSSGKWAEEKTIDVAADEPVVVEFHRGWVGDRRVTGRLTLDGALYEPSLPVAARAWTPERPYEALASEPAVRPDGTFEVAFDAENVSLLVVDTKKRRSGFAHIGPGDANIDLPMLATATYSGTLLDESAQPVADRTLTLHVAEAGVKFEATAAQTTDGAGHFRFLAVPVGVPLQLRIENEKDGPQYFPARDGLLFDPGEKREDDKALLRQMNSDTPIAQKPIPMVDRVKNSCRDARLNGMLTLVVLQGDDSTGVARLRGHFLDYDAVKEVLRYVTILVTADQLKSEAGIVTGNGWPMPAAGEIVVVVLNGEQKMIAAERFKVDDPASAAARGTEFLRQHAPPARDALVLLVKAENEARASGRRLWFVEGGPRCGPCFRLAH